MTQKSKSGPGFILVGATRSGTSTLYEALKKHPYIFVSEQKEIQFFLRDHLYSKGLGWYEQHFATAPENTTRGEICPIYMEKGIRIGTSQEHIFDLDEDCASRIRQSYPDMKLIFSLRHPIERAQSIFWKSVWTGFEPCSTFDEAVQEELQGKREPEKHRFCYLYRSRYETHLTHWLNLFPRNNILITIFDRWTTQPAKSIQDIESHLNVITAGMTANDILHYNEGRSIDSKLLKKAVKPFRHIRILRAFQRRLTRKGYQEMLPQTRQKLLEFFAPDTEYIEKQVGFDLPEWRR